MMLPSLCSLSIGADPPEGSGVGQKRPREDELMSKKGEALNELKKLEDSFVEWVSGHHEEEKIVFLVKHFCEMSASKNGQLYWLLNHYTPGSHEGPYPKGIEKSDAMLDDLFHTERLLVGLGFLCSKGSPYGLLAQNQEDYMQNQANDPFYNPELPPEKWECPSKYIEADFLIGAIVDCIERKSDEVWERMNEAHSPFVHSYDLLINEKNLYNYKCNGPSANPNADMAAMFRQLLLYMLSAYLPDDDPVYDVVPFIFMIHHKIFAVGESLKDTNDRFAAFKDLERWCKRTTASLARLDVSYTTEWKLEVCKLALTGLKCRLLSTMTEENGEVKIGEFPETQIWMPSRRPKSYYCKKEEEEPMLSQGRYRVYDDDNDPRMKGLS